MIDTLKLKPDFARTLARFEAWWCGEIIDRPPIYATVTPSRPVSIADKQYPNAAAQWFDIEYRLERAIADLERTDFVGDDFPRVWANLGPEITGTVLGATIEYIDEHTGWSAPIVHELDDWQRVIATQPNFDNPFWQAMERMTSLALDASDGRYVVGMTDLHGNYDLLASLREPEQLCLDMMDDAALVRRAGAHATAAYIAAFERCYAPLAAAGHPATTWCPILHDGPAYLPSCDFWCMLSPDAARRMVLPDIEREMAGLQRSLFHLDGPQALAHLDLLLEMDHLNAVQWVYGAGGGRATDWIDVYQRIQNAGKSIQLVAQDPADAAAVMEQLRPEGVWITVVEPFGSVATAQAFIDRFGG